MIFLTFGGPPSIPPPPPPPPPTDEEDEARLAELARQRRDLEARRAGRRALRIDRNPGVSATGGGGLRIPEP